MLDFLVGKFIRQRAQKAIDRLDPEVSAHIPMDLPLPSVSTIKKMCAAVSKANALEDEIARLSDDELKAKSNEFKSRYQEAVKDKKDALNKAEDQYKELEFSADQEHYTASIEEAKEALKKEKQKVLNDLLPEAFAVVRETSKRVLSMRHYDIQLVGGIVLHEGKIAEMATGEGKTLVATAPAYLNAITGEGVHIVTVNDYLANRDRHWMGPVFEFCFELIIRKTSNFIF